MGVVFKIFNVKIGSHSHLIFIKIVCIGVRKIKRLILILVMCMLVFVGCANKEVFPTSSGNLIIDKSVDKQYIQKYIELINNYEKEHDNLKYELIYFNNDEIPELVLGENSYFVSMYSYVDGKMYTIMEQWSYGAAGNAGYDFAERSGIIHNFNHDFAGHVINRSYCVLNDDYEFDVFTNTSIGVDIESTDEMYEEIMSYLNSYGGYYHNDEKITEEEFYKGIKGAESLEFKILEGTKTFKEIVAELNRV